MPEYTLRHNAQHAASILPAPAGVRCRWELEEKLEACIRSRACVRWTNPKFRYLHTVAVSERRSTPSLSPRPSCMWRPVSTRTRTTHRHRRRKGSIANPPVSTRSPQTHKQTHRTSGAGTSGRPKPTRVRQRSPAHAQRRSVRKPKIVIYTRAPRPREYAREGFCRLRIPGDGWMNGRYT